MPLTTDPHPALASMPKDSCGIVVEHATDAGTSERLAALGLSIGASFRVVRAGKRMVVRVGESCIGLGPDLSAAVRAIVRAPTPR
jgi:Fe2+ transport system protein FeoA